jgi:uncharacterized membrane protein
MREAGFDEFADLWQDPEEGEQEAFEALARRARRHGRLLAYGDIAMAVLIVGGTALGMVMTPHPVTAAVALVLLVATGWVTWQRRKLRQMTATLNTTDRAGFLESSIRNASANLRRVMLSLMFFPFLIALAVLFKLSLRDDRFWEHPLAALAGWAGSVRGVIALTLLATAVLLLLRSRRRIRAELRRLQQLDVDYAAEAHREKQMEETGYPR